MVKMLRVLISRLNGQVMSRLSAKRLNLSVPITISIAPDKNPGGLSTTVKLSTTGETRDLSATGVAFYVHSIRLREHYLVGENQILNARLELPGGTIRMQLVGQRYEQVDVHSSHSQYLIGASILTIEDADAEAYAEFLRFGVNGKTVKAEVSQLRIEAAS